MHLPGHLLTALGSDLLHRFGGHPDPGIAGYAARKALQAELEVVLPLSAGRAREPASPEGRADPDPQPHRVPECPGPVLSARSSPRTHRPATWPRWEFKADGTRGQLSVVASRREAQRAATWDAGNSWLRPDRAWGCRDLTRPERRPSFIRLPALARWEVYMANGRFSDTLKMTPRTSDTQQAPRDPRVGGP